MSNLTENGRQLTSSEIGLPAPHNDNNNYRGLARDVIHDVNDGRRHVGGIFSRPGRFNGNNVRKRPKIGHFSGPIETFQCIKLNRNFDVKIWKVFIYLHLDFLGN
jgi:hypothetical protein